jgi:hypothetical protein
MIAMRRIGATLDPFYVQYVNQGKTKKKKKEE